MNQDRAAFEAAFQRVSDFLRERVGHTLFTVSRNLPGGQEVERIYSSLPVEYPQPVLPAKEDSIADRGAAASPTTIRGGQIGSSAP